MTDASESIDLDGLRALANERNSDLTQLVPTVTMTARAVLALVDRAESAERRIERVRALHRPFRYYEHEDSCSNHDEGHRAERHVEFEMGEYYCEDMPTGDVVCDYCRDEDGERADWPCETVKALNEGDKQ